MYNNKMNDSELMICENYKMNRGRMEIAHELSTSDGYDTRLYIGRTGLSRLCIDAIVDRSKTTNGCPVFYINDNTRPYLYMAMRIIKDWGDDSSNWRKVEHDEKLSNIRWDQLLDNAVTYKKGIQIIPYSENLYHILFIKNDNSMTVIRNGIGKRFIARLINAKSIKLKSHIQPVSEKYIVYHYSQDSRYPYSSSVIDYKYNENSELVKWFDEKYGSYNEIFENVYFNSPDIIDVFVKESMDNQNYIIQLNNEYTRCDITMDSSNVEYKELSMIS